MFILQKPAGHFQLMNDFHPKTTVNIVMHLFQTLMPHDKGNYYCKGKFTCTPHQATLL